MALLRKNSPSIDDKLASPSVESKNESKKEPLSIEDHQPNTPASPPAYQDAISDPPSDLPAGSNGIALSQTNKSIKGTWVIDTRLTVPSALSSSSSSGSANYNLSLSTKNGSIKADVALISGAPDRATMLLHGYNGSIKFNLIRRINDQPFKVILESWNGSLTIHLPRSFVGPIRHDSKSKKTFSDEMNPRVRVISDKCSFHGSWEEARFVDFESWKGDEVDAKTHNGSIKFAYYDSPEVTQSRCTSFFGSSK